VGGNHLNFNGINGMKRRQFFQNSIVAVSATTITDFDTSRIADREVFKTAAGEGRKHGHIQLKGVNENVIDIKISGKDTNGDFLMFEQTSLSPKRGTPLHLHYNQDEVFFVLEGEYLFQVGEEKFTLRRGDTIFLPRNVPHAWSQLLDKGKMIVTLQPAGKLEEFFLTMSAMKTVPSAAEVAKIFEENEMKVVGPPLKIE
jgi:quercetin dioxygenase-like cupin family protein